MASETVLHIVPVDDLIEHDTDGAPCACGATTELHIGCCGNTGRLVTHYSLDGREWAARGQAVPAERC
jgi:hypothetical protein